MWNIHHFQIISCVSRVLFFTSIASHHVAVAGFSHYAKLAEQEGRGSRQVGKTRCAVDFSNKIGRIQQPDFRLNRNRYLTNEPNQDFGAFSGSFSCDTRHMNCRNLWDLWDYQTIQLAWGTTFLHLFLEFAKKKSDS